MGFQECYEVGVMESQLPEVNGGGWSFIVGCEEISILDFDHAYLHTKVLKRRECIKWG